MSPASLSVRVLYFASLRDLLGVAEEQLELPIAEAGVETFSRALVRRHPELAGRLASARFAINEEFASKDDRLRSGDVIAVIPPVSGG